MDSMGIVVEAVCHIPNLNVFADFSSKNTPSHSWGKNENQTMAVSDWMSSKQYRRTIHQTNKMVELEQSSILKNKIRKPK
jgi:hypothetical protein